MVKLQDGSLVMASELISGLGEDDDGNQLKFVQSRGSQIPTYKAEADMTDGSGRKKVYLFDLFDTQVRVDVKVVEPDAEQEASQQEQEPKPDEEKKKEEDKDKEVTQSKTEARTVTTKVPPRR